MATKPDDKVLIDLVNATGAMSEGLATIAQTTFSDTLKQYLATSKSFLAAAAVFGPNDVSRKTADADAVTAISEAMKARKLKWSMTPTTISRLRTLRFHTADTLLGFGKYVANGHARRDLSQYVSYLGKLNADKPKVTLNGTLTAAGKAAVKAKDDKKAKRAATRATTFDFAAFTTETGLARAVTIRALIHDAEQELARIVADIGEKEAAKVGSKFARLLASKAG